MESNKIKLLVGGAFELGGKLTQEDYIVCISDLNQYIPSLSSSNTSLNSENIPLRSFFAVFDGHGGNNASYFLATSFYIKLAQHPKICTQPITALQDTWRAMELELHTYCRSGDKFLKDGSTATVCLIISSTIYITNCGDSSAHIQMTDGTHSIVTELHNTLNHEEVERCESAGGKVMLRKVPTTLFSCCLPFRISPISSELLQPRVYPGGLLITRSFGDFYAKDLILGGIPGSVICDHGQIRTFPLSRDIKYIVLASDGVWDALSSQEIFQIIDECLTELYNNNTILPSPLSIEALSLREDTGSNLIAQRRELSYFHSSVASEVCNRAISSPYWKKLNCPADNASCIIISMSNST